MISGMGESADCAIADGMMLTRVTLFNYLIYRMAMDL